MTTVIRVSSAIFDVLLAPFGHGLGWIDLLVWPVLCGILALITIKFVSNQKGIERAKARIATHLYEIRLFGHDPVVVIGSTARIFFQNGIYVGHNVLPMLVMLAPMTLVLTQLEANYAFDPAPDGTVELLHVELDPSATRSVRDVKLDLPAGVVLDAPPVRTADGEVFYRLRAEAPGDHVLRLEAGGDSQTKTWSVGGGPRKVAVKRTKSLESILYPGEPPLPASSAFHTISIAHPETELGWLPGGELGVLSTFFGLSLVAGFALKGVFGVTL